MNDNKYNLKNQYFFGLALIIVFILIVVMTINNLNYYVRKNKDSKNLENKITLHKLEENEKPLLKSICLIVSGQAKNNSIYIIEDSLEKADLGYSTKASFKEITENDLQEAEIIIINGKEINTVGNINQILENLKKGKSIIFTSMPDVNYIQENHLEEILGIKNLTKSGEQIGVNFLPGFMIGGLLKFPELKFKAPIVELLSTTKTYVTSFNAEPLIWRNTYGGSEVYVVNGPFFESKSGYGIMSAFLSEIYDDYIYPIVNSKVYTYTGFPFINYENDYKLKEIYGRSAMQIQKDILLPDISSINRSRNLIPSGFLTINYNNKIDNYNLKQIKGHEKNIYILGGEVGLVYSKNFYKDINTYKNVFNKKNSASLLVNRDNVYSVKKYLENNQNNTIESIYGEWILDKDCFEFISKNTVYIPITLNGVYNTDLEKLEFYSGVTAFGAIIQNLNLENIIFPQDEQDNWMNVSRDYVKFIDSYRQKFNIIKSRNINDTSHEVKKFILNSPNINYLDDKIEIRFDEWFGESYYFLRTNKKIISITNGTVEKIEDGVYLITVMNEEVDIVLKHIDRYE